MHKKLILIIIFLYATQLFAQKDLSLEDCINYALNHNISIQQSSLSIQIKKIDLDQRYASLLPSFNASISQNFSYGNSLDYTTYEYVKESTSSNYFQIGTNLTIFQGLYKHNNIKSGKLSYDASKEALKDVKDQISINVASTYLQILMNLEQIDYAENQLSLSNKLLEKAKILVEVGEETKSKILELNAQFANDEVSLVEAENQLEQSYLILKEILNWDISKELDIEMITVDTSYLTDYSDYELKKSIDEHISKLPAIKKAELDYLSSIYAHKASFGNKYPNLGLQGGLDTRYSSFENYSMGIPVHFREQINNNFGQGFGFSLSIPIFNNLRNTFAIQSAKINMLTTELNLKSNEISARNSIYEAYYTVQNANKKHTAARKSLKAQQLLFEQSNLMYKEGVISFYDWQNAKNNLAKAESSFVNSKYDYLFRIKVFEYYIGKEIQL